MIPETPESKVSGSIINNSPAGIKEEIQNYDKGGVDLSIYSNLEVPNQQENPMPSPTGKLIKSKSKSKNILRLNTKPGEIGFRIESKRKRKKSHKNQKSAHPIKMSTFKAQYEANKSEISQPKTIGKQVAKTKIEENKDEAKTRPLTCNCKKSRCLKFYCDCLADGRMCTPECNC